MLEAAERIGDGRAARASEDIRSNARVGHQFHPKVLEEQRPCLQTSVKRDHFRQTATLPSKTRVSGFRLATVRYIYHNPTDLNSQASVLKCWEHCFRRADAHLEFRSPLRSVKHRGASAKYCVQMGGAYIRQLPIANPRHW